MATKGKVPRVHVESNQKSSDAEQGAELSRVSQWAIEKLDFKVNVPS